MPGGPGRNGPRYRVLIGFFRGARAGGGAPEPGPFKVRAGIRRKGRRSPGTLANGSCPAICGESGLGVPGASHLEDFRPRIPGLEILRALQKFSKEMRTEVKTVLFAGNGILLMCAGNLRVENAPRFLTGVKGIQRPPRDLQPPVCGSRTFLAAWGSRVEPSISHSILRPLKEKLDPAGSFPPSLPRPKPEVFHERTVPGGVRRSLQRQPLRVLPSPLSHL